MSLVQSEIWAVSVVDTSCFNKEVCAAGEPAIHGAAKGSGRDGDGRQLNRPGDGGKEAK